MTQKIYQKQLSIGNILSESWKKFKENFQLILLIILAVYIPINVILSFIPLDALMEERGIFWTLRIYMRVVQILEGLIGIIATMAIAYIIKSKIDGKTVSFSEALKKSLSRWPAVIWTSAMLGVFLLALTLLLIIPGIIYYVYWTFALYAVILYDKSGRGALDYSKSIVSGRWLKVAWYSLVLGLLAIIVSLIIGSIEGLILGLLSILSESSIILILEILLDSFTDFLLAYFTVVSVIFFINFDSTKKSRVSAR